MPARLDVDRGQVLAYRTAAHGLARDGAEPAGLEILDLGVQDSYAGSARLALAARLPAVGTDPLADPAYALAWTVRGAPHLHRRADLPGLAAALWPASDADASSRLGVERAALRAAGLGGLEAFAAVSQALRDAVHGPTPKGTASAAVTAALPGAYSFDCPSCKATHVYGGVFQQAGVFAGVGLVPDRTPATLYPLEGRPPVPPQATGATGLLRTYLRLHGPATLAEAAAFVGTTRTALRPGWPGDLVEVRVDGERAWIVPERVEALRDAAPLDALRLLPPHDPYLQARDRDLLVPDAARRKAVWRALANPGAVVERGEVVGTWRARVAGGRLEVTVHPFEPLAAANRAALAEEAARVATVRGASDLRVHYEAG